MKILLQITTVAALVLCLNHAYGDLSFGSAAEERTEGMQPALPQHFAFTLVEKVMEEQGHSPAWQPTSTNPFLGQIVMFAGNFAPRGWAFCDGQLLPISQNQALFSLLGTIYGGDGRTSFALPDLRGRIPLHPGSGPGLSSRILGQKGGQENVTLTQNQMPSHTHTLTKDAKLRVRNATGTENEAAGNYLANSPSEGIYSPGPPDNEMAAGVVNLTATLGNTGGSQAHNNMPPFLAVNFIIALEGTFPSRN